ncbi:hypothetical protein [Candidatus Nitrosotenuis uzonensis]|uniref:Uncharacterized protein n=1 Tax=Candidatus Nitrosotenuis uzonensis TaxID=1407055 RepID=A0A812F492_9ARCH|nr:hypothetical protein [Candidatus Nitrosotenuis uzonensis]CAE6500661.1 conserved membrane hypothetical protein [Candidatus Nitrosotenuis uzonensis]
MLDISDLKEKMILLGITAVVFLPLRLLASHYLFDHWLGNLGIATLISVTLIILIKKEKLGRLGIIFKKQITKTLWSKSAKIIVCTLVIFMVYFGTTILLVDRGNTIYYEDKLILSDAIAQKDVDRVVLEGLSGPAIAHEVPLLAYFHYMEYIFSISYAMLNDATGGWLVNLHLIMFMEQVEILGLLWFFKRYFRPAIIS